MTDRIKLQPAALQSLPLGTILPQGWLKQQLQIQLDGLSGHLEKFWPDIKDSGWIGGKAEGWERAPYWLDGYLPLAFLLQDETHIAHVHRWMDYIIKHQQPDGWLGPVPDKHKNDINPHELWAQFIMLKVLAQYVDRTGSASALQAIIHGLHKVHDHMQHHKLEEWGRFRWPDLCVTIFWLYDRDPQPWLLELAGTARSQGYNWQATIDNLPSENKTGTWNLETHVVNNAMGIKQAGIVYRLTGKEKDRQDARRFIDTLHRHHGMVNGVFSGDECFSGRNPSQGTECCAVNEYMFSLETLYAILGEADYADHLERITFNALPATFSPDMWAHQYVQQVNQIACKEVEHPVYNDNGPEANLFGLEPHFGCCTANMHQGWPKFTTHLWMKEQDSTLTVCSYAPCSGTAEISGITVRWTVDTAYPFNDRIQMTFTAETPVTLAVKLRIPVWATEPALTVNDQTVQDINTPFHTVEFDLSNEAVIQLRLPMSVAMEHGYNNSVAVVRGPLVYAMPVPETWHQIHTDRPYREQPHADWEVLPQAPWNFALCLEENGLPANLYFSEQEVGVCPFSPEGAPVRASTKGRLLPDWTLDEHEAAQPPPESPVSTDEPEQEITLIPYGCTHLRITQFPTYSERSRYGLPG